MIRAQSFILPALLVTTVVAQDKVNLTITRQSSKNLEYTITTSSEISTSREFIIDGEARNFGGGGDGQLTTIDKKVVFVESPAGKWRHYKTAQATVVRPGRDGEEQETEVKGEFQGQRLFFDRSADTPKIRLASADGEELSQRQTGSLPLSMDLSALAPKDAIAVGSDYDISKGLRDALANLIHPVRQARTEGGGRGEGGQRGRRGEGGEGGQRGRRGEGGEGGQRGRRGGGFRGFGGANTTSPALSALTNKKLSCEAKGNLISIENGIAKIAITGKITGKGTPMELSIGGSSWFGRGRRGGGGGEVEDPGGEASVSIKLKGELLIDTNTHTVNKLIVKGSMDSSSELIMDRGDREIEMNSTNSGSFSLRLACAKAKTKTVEAAGKDKK